MKEARQHIISLPELDDGVYKTAWRALSEDGHAIKGEFIFEVSPKGSGLSGADVKLLMGEGKVKRIRGTKITIKHGPLGELMPAMTMEFNVSDKKVISNFKRGDNVTFQVNKKLMSRAYPDAIFMHCLPVGRGEEVTDEVIDGKQSVVWRQALNRVHAQKSIIKWCLD